MADAIHKPLIILGAARSGTGLLAGSLARHPDLAWIEEPNFVWKAYNADVGHDMIPPTRATPRVKRYIHERFDAMRIAQGAPPRIVEKTPQSAMRLPFVLEVFPDALLVHVIRDGRQVVASARRKSMGAIGKVTRSREGMSERRGSVKNARTLVRVLEDKWRAGFPLRDLPRYAPKIWNMSLGMLGVKETFAWGPEFPGMRRMIETHPLVDVCALQWQICVEGVRNVLASRPELPVYETRFERLVAEPEKVTREIFEFADLPQRDDLRPLPPSPFDATIDLFETELDAAERRIVYDRIGATLAELGYARTPERSASP
jgi:hypothetical protein